MLACALAPAPNFCSLRLHAALSDRMERLNAGRKGSGDTTQVRKMFFIEAFYSIFAGAFRQKVYSKLPLRKALSVHAYT